MVGAGGGTRGGCRRAVLPALGRAATCCGVGACRAPRPALRYCTKYGVELDPKLDQLVGVKPVVPWRKFCNADNAHLCSPEVGRARFWGASAAGGPSPHACPSSLCSAPRAGSAAQAYDLLGKLLQYDHHERPTCAEAMAHAYFDPVRGAVEQQAAAAAAAAAAGQQQQQQGVVVLAAQQPTAMPVDGGGGGGGAGPSQPLALVADAHLLDPSQVQQPAVPCDGLEASEDEEDEVVQQQQQQQPCEGSGASSRRLTRSLMGDGGGGGGGGGGAGLGGSNKHPRLGASSMDVAVGLGAPLVVHQVADVAVGAPAAALR